MSCTGAGGDGGFVGKVVSSCNGGEKGEGLHWLRSLSFLDGGLTPHCSQPACYELAENGGYVGEIKDSCNKDDCDADAGCNWGSGEAYAGFETFLSSTPNSASLPD